MKPFRVLPFALVVLTIGAAPAAAAVSDWSGDGDKARVRLVAAGLDAAGKLRAAIEIELAPGWKTYWRTPGDAGIPPVIDFTASQNVGAIEIGFPPPERHDDGYSVTNTYEGNVVLPLSVAVPDAKADASLALKLDIGVCSDVCVPDHFELALPVPAGGADADADKIVTAAEKALPGKPEPGKFEVTSVKRDGGTGKHSKFLLTAIVPDAANATIWVEGAPDWYPDIPEYEAGEGGKANYRFTFDTLGSKTPLDGGKLRVTIVSNGRAIEQWVALP